MISTYDMQKVLYADCRGIDFSPVIPEAEYMDGVVPIYHGFNVPKGAVEAPRITIHIKESVNGTVWTKRYVEINLSVPDLDEDIADMHLLGQVEQIMLLHFKTPRTGELDSGSYEYSLDSYSQEQDTQLKCHFVHIRLLFQILNTL